MRRVSLSAMAGVSLLALAGLAAAQQAPPTIPGTPSPPTTVPPSPPPSTITPGQCATNVDDINRCTASLVQCTTSFTRRAQALSDSQKQVTDLRQRTCAQEQEPVWREIIKGIVDKRLQSLKKVPTETECEAFDWVFGNNGKLTFTGRVRGPLRDAVQKAKADLTAQLPGLDISDSEMKSQSGPCPEIVIPGWIVGSATEVERRTLEEDQPRYQRIPPAAKCIELGQGSERLAREKAEAMARCFWVLVDGRWGACRKSTESVSGGWVVETTNLSRCATILMENE